MLAPIRMCVVCRYRFEQQELLRLGCKDGILMRHDGIGRSFYICDFCQTKEKMLYKALRKMCKKDITKQSIKELFNGHKDQGDGSGNC